MLKSQYKAIKYSASNSAANSKAKTQGSDYYVAFFDSAKNKVYCVQAETCYQMSQKIDGFMEDFGVKQDIDQAVRNLEYYEQKKLVAGSFGTDKAKRKLASVMTNRVDDN